MMIKLNFDAHASCIFKLLFKIQTFSLYNDKCEKYLQIPFPFIVTVLARLLKILLKCILKKMISYSFCIFPYLTAKLYSQKYVRL